MKKKGIIGAVVSAVCILLYYLAMAALFFTIPDLPSWCKLALCLIPLAFCIVIIAVLTQRIREVNSGETDDLDNY